jgi:hypothetical protein
MFGWVLDVNLQAWLMRKIGSDYPYAEYPYSASLEMLQWMLFFVAVAAFPIGLIALRRWGMLSIAIGLVVLIIEWPRLFRYEKPTSPESSAVANLRYLNTAEVSYLSSAGVYGDVPQLITSGLLDSRYASSIAGYRFNVVASGSNYTATAIPTSMNVGRYGFYSTPDAVIRYATETCETCKPCFPPGQSGAPVQ